MQISAKNSRQTRDQLISGYDFKGIDELKNYLAELVKIVVYVFRGRQNYSFVRQNPLQKAVFSLVEGRRTTVNGRKASKAVMASRNSHQNLARQLIRLLLLESSDAIESFAADLSNAIAEAYGLESCDVLEVLECRDGDKLREHIKSLSTRTENSEESDVIDSESKGSYYKKEEKVTLYCKALSEICGEPSDEPLSQSRDMLTYYHVGSQDEIRSMLKKLTGFSYNQLQSARQLAHQERLIYIEGSTTGGKAEFYLREDQLQTSGESERAEGVAPSLEGVSFQADNLPKLLELRNEYDEYIAYLETGQAEYLEKQKSKHLEAIKAIEEQEAKIDDKCRAAKDERKVINLTVETYQADTDKT